MGNKYRLTDLIPVEAIRERDTDMLLLEELKCNRDFTDWILKKTINFKGKYKVDGVWHSLTQVNLGESDLAFKISTSSGKILFLFENKIDSGFMPAQAKRYRKRGLNMIEMGECSRFYTILFSPLKYMYKNDDFDFYLEYEEMRDWFLSQSHSNERLKFKAEVLNIAIERLRRGYNPIINNETTKFKWDYFNYVEKHYPYLKMKRPRELMPKKTGFMRFQPEKIGMGKKEYIVHKNRGDVDLQLHEAGKDIDYFIDKYGEKLFKGMEIVKTGKSTSIRLKTPEIDIESDFKKQLPEIEKALDKVRTLYRWAKRFLKDRMT